jgi:hypothetical protein
MQFIFHVDVQLGVFRLFTLEGCLGVMFLAAQGFHGWWRFFPDWVACTDFRVAAQIALAFGLEEGMLQLEIESAVCELNVLHD